MSAHLAPGVRSASKRVALAATAIVAGVYLLVAVAVALIVTRNLTADMDARLTASLHRAVGASGRPSDGDGAIAWPRETAPHFSAPLLRWMVFADGTVVSPPEQNADLPRRATYRGPATVSVDGTDVRVVAAQIGPTRYVVGQSTASITQARSTVVLAELVVGPALLVVVFLGALAIGRRVASPIELARVRQMEFTADASHELRTPLSVIEAQASLALSQVREPAWYRSAFRRVEAESRRIRRLVEDLLWLARFDATRAGPEREHVDVGVLAGAAADRFGAVAESRRVDLTVSGDEGPAIVQAPPDWLDRLLGVLLDNACRYTPEGGRITLRVSCRGGRVRVAVDDSGPGIPADRRDRIFDRFHRETDAPGGAGLGLAMPDAVVRATGGRWDVGTAPEGGASMAVTWPRALTGGAAPRGAASGAGDPARRETRGPTGG